MRSSSFDTIESSTCFQGVKKLCLQWRLARKNNELPFYEDVGIGSLGSIADDTALLQPMAGGRLLFLRTGASLAERFGQAAAGTAVDDLDANYRDPLHFGIRQAFEQEAPTLHLARSVSDGLVVTSEILSLPLRNRWGGHLALTYVKQRPKSHDLVEAIYRSTSNGLLALAALPRSTGVPDFQIVSLNGGAAVIFGRPEADIRWKFLSDLVPIEQAGLLYAKLDQALGSQTSSEFEFGYSRSAAAPVHLRISVAPIGNLLGVTVTDISDIKVREESVKSLFESNPMPLLLYERETLRILRVNDALVRRYGYSTERWQTLTLPELHTPEERERIAEFARRPAGDGESQRLWHHLTADGTSLEIHAYSRELTFDGRLCILSSIVDVTEQRKVQARVVFMAHHDHLTSLANRVLFRTCLDEGLVDCRRGTARLAVHSIDLDHFKRVNDTLGHSVGDEVLRAAADRLRGAISGKDMVARLGGDEFAVIQFDPETEDDVGTLARRLIERVSAPYLVGGRAVTLGASIGISVAPGDALESDAILKNADVALYRAKADGKGRHRFYEAGMDRRMRERRSLEEDLREAVANGRLALHYQPLLETSTETIVGCEALLRWTHPVRGPISPSEFVPLAEEIGLIGTLGDWVLRAACAEAAHWPEHIRLAVNLSPAQFRDDHLTRAIASALGLSGLAPSRLELEITESVLLFESESNRAILRRLRDLGVTISLDDFGTGYSSLSYLRSFPVDKIKIDRSFVHDLADNPGCMAIIRAVMSLGDSLGITTLAEGVETVDQFTRLRAEGCAQVQGFLFSKPLPGPLVRELLARRPAAAPRAA